MKPFREALSEIRKQCAAGEAARRAEAFAAELKKKPVILYGAGTLSGFVTEHLAKYNVGIECFCDTFRSGTHATGLPIISADRLNDMYPDAFVVVTSELHGASILNTLQKIECKSKIYTFDELLCFYTIPFGDFEPHTDGFEWAYERYADEVSKRNVVDLMRTRLLGTPMAPSASPQYFETDVCPLTEREVFVDGGCFIGDTAEEFIKQTRGMFTHIYGFEPDEGNIKKAMSALSRYDNVDVIRGGLWHTTNISKFASGGFGGSRFSEDGDTTARTYGLDDFFGDKQPPTFIKMDIEGAELDALNGASELIKTCKPKQAICVYHKIQDMYALLRRILELNPGYTLTLRHYSRWYAESVCYAV
jgi:FkbM family methyltransferase